MSKAFRLGVISMGPNDAMSWYRSLGPLSQLARHGLREGFTFAQLMPGNPSWANVYACDGIFMQRGHTPEALAWVKVAKSCGLKVWLDYDDDLLNLPPEHPAYHVFVGTRHYVEQMLVAADVVSVSTPKLKESYDRYNKDIRVIPNAMDDYFVNAVEKPADMYDTKRLAWRGGFSHREDLELARSLFTREDYRVVYFGHNPPWIRLKHDDMFAWSDIPLYLLNLVRSAAGTLVVPLKNNLLNQAKSNCSWLEATWFGLATAHVHDGTPLPEFTRPGILSEAQLLEANQHTLWAAREASLKDIRENYLLSNVNRQRAEIIEQLSWWRT